MWTPKRILILLGGLTLFVAGYFVYAYFLGGIDGLPVLTAEYLPLPPGQVTEDDPTKGRKTGESELKLNYAFGNGCEEATRKIKIDLRSREVILAAQYFEIIPDGRVKLQPFSAAKFTENKAGGHPEIKTMKSDSAYLTLDKPVSNMAQLSNCKIIGVELVSLTSPIILTHNRSTPELTDDLEVIITRGSMFYLEKTNLIWTDGFVQLFDHKTEPHPTIITAKGMELQLAEESGPNRPKTTKVKGKENASSALEMIVLKNNVDMSMYLDANAGFPAGPGEGSKEKAPLAKGELPEKSHVVIKTNGPFHYDLKKDLAWFDSPPPSGTGGAEQVLVIREHKAADGKKYDQLLCNHLELQLRKKEEDDPKGTRPKAPRDAGMPDKEIATALATASVGDLVVLTMDSENLEAKGTELHYISPTAGTGPQTILKGAPLRALKDGHKILAQELRLVGADKYGNGQRAYGRGPGQIDLFDKTNPTNSHPNHAKWNDNLLIVKERDGDKFLDVITMTGNASFEDDVHKQALSGERLQVTMESSSSSGEDGRKVEINASSVAKQNLRRIEAFEKVRAHAPEYILRDAKHLDIRVRTGPGPGGQLPDVLPQPVPPPPQTSSLPIGVSRTVASPPPPAAPQLATPQLGAPQPTVPQVTTPQISATPVLAQKTSVPVPAKVGKPLELWAEDVVAYVITQGDKRELDELITERAVHVHRDAEESQDKKATNNGVDITGEMLHLVHHARGDTLFVFGDARKPARLQLGELLIMGPKVTINQKDNMADVEGEGAMSMPSDTSFEGGSTGKAKTLLKIHWSKNMLFDGKKADFYGNVQAYQDDANMKCDYLAVRLDRMVSFKEGQKENQNASVDHLMCDRNVWVEDTKRDATGKRVQFDRLHATQLDVDHRDGPVIAHGPGMIEHLAAGDADDPLSGPTRRPKDDGAKKESVSKLTRIRFEGRMNSNNKDNSRNAKFYDNVEVFYFPSEDPNAQMNPDRPVKDGFYMRCNNLSVYTTQIANKKSQIMVAENNVNFRTDEIFGRASVMKFNESEEQVIFLGVPGNPAASAPAGGGPGPAQ